MWDVHTAERSASLAGHESWVRSVTFSPDGARIASGSYDGTVRIWDAFSRGLIAARTVDAEGA